MNSLKMQPTFVLDVSHDADDAVRRLKEAVRTPELQPYAIAAGSCVEFQICSSDQHFWSPHLSVQLGKTDSGTKLYGRFSPRPEIWTMFMAIYAIVTTGICGAAVYGYVQWFMGATPWTLLLVPVGILLIASLHVSSLIGQRLSSDQMQLLRQRLDRALEIAFE